MNIEHITDADYMAVPERRPSEEHFKQLGPPLKCGSLTLVSNCSYRDCPCRLTQVSAR